MMDLNLLSNLKLKVKFEGSPLCLSAIGFVIVLSS